MNICRFLVIAIAAVSVLSCQHTPAHEETVNLFFETDMGNDVDDAIALDVIYKYVALGKVNLLGIGINKGGLAPLQYTDVLNTWYGYPQTPLGRIENASQADEDDRTYARAANLTSEQGSPLFARSVEDYASLPQTHLLLRRILSEQPDNSVTIASVGFSTNLARLLESGPDEYSSLTGEDLVKKKVKLLVTMAGNFDGELKKGEYNVITDSLSAAKVFSDWPGVIVTSPWELGIKVRYPAESIENDFGWAIPAHPVVEGYKLYKEMPYDRPCWDPTAVLYAIGERNFFNISQNGTISVSKDAVTTFTPDPKGNHYVLEVNDDQARNLVDLLVKTMNIRME